MVAAIAIWMAFLLFVSCLVSFQSTSSSDKSSGMPALMQTSQLCICRSSPFTNSPLTDAKTRKEKLEQVASFSLFGNVMSMASVQLTGASKDALLLSFKDAKVTWSECCSHLNCWGLLLTDLGAFPSLQLSVVEYDPGTHDLKTLSLHYFEEPELRVCVRAKTAVEVLCFSLWRHFVSFLGRLFPERAHPHCSRGSREPLCRDAHLRHQARSAAVPERHTVRWAGGRSWRGVRPNFRGGFGHFDLL